MFIELPQATKQQITVHACFSADSNFKSLYPGERLHNIEFAALFMMNESGWMNQAIFCKWIQCFHQHLDKEKIEPPVILFIDGHWSHISLLSSRFCERTKLFCTFSTPMQHISHSQ